MVKSVDLRTTVFLEGRINPSIVGVDHQRMTLSKCVEKETVVVSETGDSLCLLTLQRLHPSELGPRDFATITELGVSS